LADTVAKVAEHRAANPTVAATLPPSLIETALDAAYWERLALSGLMEDALRTRFSPE
jgi:hypothetical protein